MTRSSKAQPSIFAEQFFELKRAAFELSFEVWETKRNVTFCPKIALQFYRWTPQCVVDLPINWFNQADWLSDKRIRTIPSFGKPETGKLFKFSFEFIDPDGQKARFRYRQAKKVYWWPSNHSGHISDRLEREVRLGSRQESRQREIIDLIKFRLILPVPS